MGDGDRTRGLTGVTATVVLVAAVGALVLLIRGGAGSDVLLQGYDPGAIEARVDQALAGVEIRPSRTLRVTGRRLVWADGSGAPFLETPRVAATVRIDDGGSTVVVSDGEIDEPILRLEELGAERWNYETPLAPFLEGEDRDDEEGMTVRVEGMAAGDATVAIDMLDASYELRSLDVRLSGARLSGPGLAGPTFEVSEAEGELVLPDTASESGVVVRSVRIAAGGLQLVDGVLSFQIDSAGFGGSRLASLEGTWNPALGGYGLDMTMRVPDGRVADLPWLPGEVPAGARGSLTVRLETRPGGRTLLALSDLAVTAPGSSATGSVRAVIGGEEPAVLEAIDVRVDPLSLDLAEAFTGPLPYGGTVSGTIQGPADDIQVDLRGRLNAPAIAEPFEARVTGRVSLAGEGPRLRNASVALERVPLEALEAVAPGLPLRGAVSGTIDLDGAPNDGPLGLDLRLEAAGGVVTLTGTADLTGAEPSYDVSGRLVGVNLRSLLAPDVPPLEVHADFDLEGRGTSPRTAVASLTAAGRFTGWQAEPGDTLFLRADLREGTADVQEARVEVGPIRLEASGSWGFVDGIGRLGYGLAVADLEPLAPYLPPDPQGRRQFARGAFELSGAVAGTLEAARLEGDVTVRSARWGEWAAESLTGSYAYAQGGDFPRIEADVEGRDLRTPATDFDRFDLTLDFGRPEFAFSLAADQEEDRGVVEIEASGRLDEAGRRDILIRRLEVDLRRRRWRLPRPAEIAWTEGEAIEVQGLALDQADGPGRISIRGVLSPADAMDASIDVNGLPVSDVLQLAGVDIPLAGDLSGDATITGPADSPILDVSVGLSEGTFRGVRIRSLDTELSYDTATLSVDGVGLLGDSAAIEISGFVPARLRLAGDSLFSLVSDAPIELRIVSRTFPLSTADPGLTMVEDVAGRLEANLTIGGTPGEPRLSGAAQLYDGAMTVPVLNRRFHGIRGRVLMSERHANLERLVIQSGGRAVVRGTIDFQDLTNPAFDVDASLEQLQIQGLDGDEASLDGSLQLGGTLTRPVVTGNVRADSGALSLAPLQQPELSNRLTDSRLPLADEPSFDDSAPDGGFSIRDLRFTAGTDLRFTTQEAEIPLAGTLIVNKDGESFPIQGTLTGEGGYFELRAGVITRQFQIASAGIRFFGSPRPNPRLDIIATRNVRTPDGGTVEIQVGVGGTLESPSLSLASAAGPAIPESELLSFLLFGRNTSDLGQVAGGGSAEALLGQSVAYLGLAEGVASQFNEAIGLFDYFQLDYVPSSGGIFATAGVELANDLFLNADLPVGGQSDLWSVALEYRADIGLLRVGAEPVQRLDRLVAARTLSFIEAEVRRQFIAAWRRRWTY